MRHEDVDARAKDRQAEQLDAEAAMAAFAKNYPAYAAGGACRHGERPSQPRGALRGAGRLSKKLNARNR